MEALYNHSVSFDPQRCVGCTNCLRRCPTEAIRIREGQARIDASRCIDCGECIKVCTHKAKRAVCDHFEQLDAYKWKIALPSPSLYGQFNHLTDPDYLVEGLYRMGFDQVYEVGRGAELVTEYTRQYLKRTDVKKPVISSACPAVVRLIRLRYPGFCDHILPIRSPLEVAAAEALKEAKRLRPNLQREEIGVAFISPCPAKVSYLKNKGKDDPSEVDVVLSIQEVYFSLLHYMKSDVPPEHCSESGMIGLGWAVTGGEATALFNEKYLAADGIENVIQVLNHLEDDSLAELEYIELNACSGGCSGRSAGVGKSLYFQCPHHQSAAHSSHRPLRHPTGKRRISSENAAGNTALTALRLFRPSLWGKPFPNPLKSWPKSKESTSSCPNTTAAPAARPTADPLPRMWSRARCRQTSAL